MGCLYVLRCVFSCNTHPQCCTRSIGKTEHQHPLCCKCGAKIAIILTGVDGNAITRRSFLVQRVKHIHRRAQTTRRTLLRERIKTRHTHTVLLRTSNVVAPFWFESSKNIFPRGAHIQQQCILRLHVTSSAP